MNDALLVQNFLDGDEEAFNTLVWQWHDPIYQFCCRFLKPGQHIMLSISIDNPTDSLPENQNLKLIRKF